MNNNLMPNYNRLPVTFIRGEGAWLWDTEGKRYLDAVTGVAVCGLGHAHPAVRDALCEQAATLVHTSNLYHVAHQQTLADRLVQLSGMDNAFFCNSGTEANEAALKLARLHGHQRGIDRPAVIVMTNSFHGRTMAALSATGNANIQAGFEPLLDGFIRVPYGDPAAVEQAANPNVVAVHVEPAQGEGGVNIPPAGYLKALRELCDRHGWLLMLDEVQTGIARTGAWFAYQHENIMPDVLCLAKGLGNGVPVGACLARGAAAQIFQPGTHGSTFGGNPLACRAALAVLDTIEQQQLVSRVAALGKQMIQGLRIALDGVAGIKEIRHHGLLLGIELDRPCGELVMRALEQGLLINVTAGNVIRLLPPFILTDAEAEQIIALLIPLIQEFMSKK